VVAGSRLLFVVRGHPGGVWFAGWFLIRKGL
jgi:hypothetical protein